LHFSTRRLVEAGGKLPELLGDSAAELAAAIAALARIDAIPVAMRARGSCVAACRSASSPSARLAMQKVEGSTPAFLVAQR
jgi:hypothetical protein